MCKFKKSIWINTTSEISENGSIGNFLSANINIWNKMNEFFKRLKWVNNKLSLIIKYFAFSSFPRKNYYYKKNYRRLRSNWRARFYTFAYRQTHFRFILKSTHVYTRVNYNYYYREHVVVAIVFKKTHNEF